MKDSTYYSAIIVILLIASILFWLGSNQNGDNTYDTHNTENIEVPVVANEILSSNFNANANITIQDISLNADINRSNANTITLSIIEPDTLKGMDLSYDGELVNVTYKGMTLSLDKNSKALNSVATILMNTIQSATAGTGVEISSENGGILLNGTSNSADFSILLNSNNNSIASIKSDSLDFFCEFSS